MLQHGVLIEERAEHLHQVDAYLFVRCAESLRVGGVGEPSADGVVDEQEVSEAEPGVVAWLEVGVERTDLVKVAEERAATGAALSAESERVSPRVRAL